MNEFVLFLFFYYFVSFIYMIFNSNMFDPDEYWTVFGAIILAPMLLTVCVIEFAIDMSKNIKIWFERF